MQDIFGDYSSNRAKERPNTAQFSSDAGLTKFVLASELFVSRPYFICHLTAKRFAKNLVAGSSIYSSKKVVKTGIKVENLKLQVYCKF